MFVEFFMEKIHNNKAHNNCDIITFSGDYSENCLQEIILKFL